jgi:pimeloyl-ACP methyl ester carboxylesterase
MKRAVLLLAAGLALLAPTAAWASPEAPFGHACTAQNGVRFCPTASDDQRVPTFDGVPIDVDVTLPAEGTGPFPTIVMPHGFPGSKASWEASSPEGPVADNRSLYHWNNVFYAQQGYAVVNYSARGFGRSCGVADSRTAPACDRGWFHTIADQRWEVHDAQHLLGLLVDEGVADPARLGATGISMGGGTTMELAWLKDRVRNVDGSFSPWTSPGGKPLSLAAANPKWGWSDLVNALVPNGRALDDRVFSKPETVSPFGVALSSTLNALAAGGSLGFIPPKGADPTADILSWTELVNAGEPYPASATDILEQLTTFKSVNGLAGGTTVPLLIQNGWTDPVFPPIEGIRAYNRLRKSSAAADVALQFGDIGHFTGGNGLAQNLRFNDDAAAFFRGRLQGTAAAGGPAPGSVTTFLQGCPKGAAGSSAIVASSYAKLTRKAFALGGRGGTVRSTGGSDVSAQLADPLQNADRCKIGKPGSAKGTVVLTAPARGVTMLGLPEIRATVRTSGKYGQLDALLWEVTKKGQRLVDYGVYRLKANQRGRVRFQLHGNGYRFGKRSTIKLELRGRTPNLYRPSNGKFSVAVSDLSATLPVR